MTPRLGDLKMILETEFYFAASKAHMRSAHRKHANIHDNSRAIKVRILSLIKDITITEIMIREWVDEKAIEIIINPKISQLEEAGQTVNIKPVVTPGGTATPNETGSEGGRLGTTPNVPIKQPNEEPETPDDGLTTQGIFNALFGFNPHRDLNLPGGEASEGDYFSEFAEAVGALATAVAGGAYKAVEAVKEANEAVGEGGSGHWRLLSQ
jgi:hypothetical protein